MNRGRALLLILSAVACASCGGGGGNDGIAPAATDPGLVDLVLSTPNTNDGALLVNVTGSVSSISSTYQIISNTPGATGVGFVVRGAVSAGPIATIAVPDRKKLSGYQVRVEQAAARATYQQQNVAAYRIELRNR